MGQRACEAVGSQKRRDHLFVCSPSFFFSVLVSDGLENTLVLKCFFLLLDMWDWIVQVLPRSKRDRAVFWRKGALGAIGYGN